MVTAFSFIQSDAHFFFLLEIDEVVFVTLHYITFVTFVTLLTLSLVSLSPVKRDAL